MRFGVLGPLAVWTDHGEPVAIPGRKVRALLAALLLHDGHPVSTDRLVELVWGAAAPADPAAALHVRVSQLRRALAGAEPGGRDVVVSAAPGYALRAGHDAIDADRFATLTSRAHAATDARARAVLLAEALGLWRGAALADFADEEFVHSASARWEEQRLLAVEAHAEARLRIGEHAELVSELTELVAGHPYRERLRAAQMRALHRSGRTAEALASFAELRGRLAAELGLDPGRELAELRQDLLTGASAEHAPGQAPPRATNLPAPVSELIGREHEVRRVRELLLTAGRLVTVTGAGGVGKTSLAVAVGLQLTDAFPDGVWLVDLSTWDGSAELAEFVLSVLSIPDSGGAAGPAGERLAVAAGSRRMLLVLDNCEHVVHEVAGLLAGLLPNAAGMRVLATSREPLRLRGETRWELPPLDIPDTDDPARLARCSAVRLFLARAGLDDGVAVPEVVEVCRRLDGIPLALELAATRVPALGVAELAARLAVPQDRFGLLDAGPRDAPARQRTLAAVIDWSWRLLSDPERVVLRRLAVHAGGCTTAAAEVVCAAGDVAAGQVLARLIDLVDRSLVVRERSGRFRLLESVAAFCLDQLRDRGELAELRRGHAEYYLAVAERTEPSLRRAGQRAALAELDAETANLRAALRTFCEQGAAASALRLAVALAWYWFLRGRLAEADRELSTALGVPGPAPRELRATAAALATGISLRLGRGGPELVAAALADYEPFAEPATLDRMRWFLASAVVDLGEQTGQQVKQLLDSATATGDSWALAAALSTRAMLAHMRFDLPALQADAGRSSELFAELGDEWGVLQATDWLIGLADLRAEHAEAQRLSLVGLRTAEELGLWADVAGRLSWLAWTAMQTERYSEAIEYGRRAKQLSAEQGQHTAEVFATLSLAFAARRRGEAEAAELLGWLLRTARDKQHDDGAPPYLSMVLVELGMHAVRAGDPAAALDWHRQGFAAYRDQDSARGMAAALDGMAAALLLDGRSGLAARLLGAADAARGADGPPLSATDRAELAGTVEGVLAEEPDFAALHAAGRLLGPEQAESLLDDDPA